LLLQVQSFLNAEATLESWRPIPERRVGGMFRVGAGKRLLNVLV
jgi:hypothetical protein